MRVLLLTLYYPPLNSIASHRAESFVCFLKQHGIEVDVITRFYDQALLEEQSLLIGAKSPAGFESTYVRQDNVIYTNFKSRNRKKRISSVLPPGLKGLYNYLSIDVYHAGWIPFLMAAFEKEFSRNKYDFIISSFGPPVMLDAGIQLSGKYNIPLVVDFRDSYITERDSGWHLAVKKIVQARILRSVSGLIFATDGIKDYFLKLSPAVQNIPSAVVYNGVPDHRSVNADPADSGVIEKFNELKNRYEVLIVHPGTVYKGQNIDFFLRNVSAWNSKQEKKIGFLFIGLNEHDVFQGEDVHFLPKVKHSTSLFIQREADALALPVWKDRYSGFSGKVLEYLESGNRIICAGQPQSDLQNFLQKGNTRIALTDSDFIESINLILTGSWIPEKGNNPLFRRSYWIGRMAEFLKALKGNGRGVLVK